MNQQNLKWVSLAIVLSAPLLSVIDVFIVNMAIPTIERSIGASDSEMQLVVAGYILGYASFMITGGRSGDYYGRKKVFFRSMIAFGITSSLCGLSQTPVQLNMARFLEGISASFMVPQTISYIQVLFESQRDRTKAIGFFGMTLGVAATIGQYLGGYFSSGTFFIAGWRLIFFINIPVCILALLAVKKYLPETAVNKAEKFDYTGTLLLTVSLITFIYPLVQGRQAGWPVWCLIMLPGSLLLFYVFIKDQHNKTRHHLAPLIDISLFSLKDFNIGIIAVSCYFLFHTSYLFITTIHFQETLHFSAMDAGLCFIFFGFGFTASSFLSIRLVTRFGKLALQVGVVIMIMMMGVQVSLLKQNIGALPIDILLVLQGFGMGLVLPSLLNFALRSVPVKFAGAAAGIYSTAQQIASATGIALIGGLYFYFTEQSSALPFKIKGYVASMYVDIGFLVLLGVALYLLPERKPDPASCKTGSGQHKRFSWSPVSLAPKCRKALVADKTPAVARK